MNVQHSLFHELMLYEFKLVPNAIRATKSTFVKGMVDHRPLTRWSKQFYSDCKNLDLARSGRPKTGFQDYALSYRFKFDE